MKTLFPLWIGEDPDAVSMEAEKRLIEAMRDTRGEFHCGLSGGSTPEGLYHRLADVPDFNPSDWAWSHFFQVDERCVPPDHPGSNFRMIQEAFFSHAPIPPAHIHRPR